MIARRGIWGALLALLLTQGAAADARLTVLMNVMRVTEVVDIMRREGLDYADDLNRDLLGGQGGSFWSIQVDRIYAPERMQETVRAALEDHLSEGSVVRTIGFFGSDTGQRIIGLENAARVAMQQEDIDEAARHSCDAPAPEDADHLALIDDFITVNDLIDRNVAGALSSNYQFYLGLADGDMPGIADQDMLREVYAQEPEIREETESWLCGYLLLAYRPLPLDALRDYLAFYDSEAGATLNAALFEGYETMYREISYALGRAVALNAVGDDI